MPVPTPRRTPSGSLSVSVVLPAGSVASLSLMIGALPPVHEVIVVVGPDEDTALALPRAARVIRQTRTGPGNALACGVAVATGDVVVTMTVDGACDPADVPRFVAALRDGADVVHGTRRPSGRARLTDLILIWVMGVLFGCRPTDPRFGYRAFWRDCGDRVGLPRVAGTEPVRGDGPESMALLAVRAGRAGLTVVEVPVVKLPATALDRTGAPLPAVVRALVAEHRHGAAPVGDLSGESIVVMTGNVPPVWPAPNPPRPPVERDLQSSGPVSGSPQIIERRRAERRRGDRRRADYPVLDRRPGAAAAPGDGLSRRRWRDARIEAETLRHRAQERPDLRVINGEGRGAKGDRGHLRSV